MNGINKFDENMNKLIITLNEIIESGKYTMLVESYNQENTLEYGIIGQPMQSVKFEDLNGESFWEFVYKGICIVAPDSIFTFMDVKGFGNPRSSMIITLNEKVEAIITNKDHKYDSFISELRDKLENNENVLEKQNEEKGPILIKKI